MKKTLLSLVITLSIASIPLSAAHATETQQLYASPAEAAIGAQILDASIQRSELERQLKAMSDSGTNMATQEARDLVAMINALRDEQADLEKQLQALRNPAATTNTAPSASAGTNQAPFGGRTSNDQAPFAGKAPAAAASQINATFENPLGGVTSLSGLFYKIVNFIIGLSYVVIAAFYLIAGFKFVKAQGNPDELSEAKRAFLNTTIGAIIIIGINVITQVIQSIIQGLQN